MNPIGVTVLLLLSVVSSASGNAFWDCARFGGCGHIERARDSPLQERFSEGGRGRRMRRHAARRGCQFRRLRPWR